MVWDSTTGRVLAAFRPTPAPTAFTHGRVALDATGLGSPSTTTRTPHTTPWPGPPWGTRCRSSGSARSPAAASCCGCRCPTRARSLRPHLQPRRPPHRGREQTDGSGSGTRRPARSLHETRWDDQSFRLAFSPDGRRLAGVSRSKVQVRDVEDGREILILRGAPSRCTTAGSTRSSPGVLDGTRLASSNWDQSISVWEPRPGGDPAAGAGRRRGAGSSPGTGRGRGGHRRGTDRPRRDSTSTARTGRTARYRPRCCDGRRSP